MKKTEKEPFDPNKKAEDTKAAGGPAGDAAAETADRGKDQKPEGAPSGKDTAPGDETPDPDTDEPDGSQTEDEKSAPDDEKIPAEEQPAQPPMEGSETDRLKAELLEARSQLAAYAAGVAPEMVADAVTLATAEAKAVGEVTEEAVAKAMDNVLKRHPEWKTKPSSGGAKKTTGGFKLGADPDSTGRDKGTAAEKGGSKKPWNKFNR